MAQKPENSFRASVHRYLPDSVQHDKMNNPYSSGVADDLYCGNRADLWVEYKYLQKVPVRADVDPVKLLSPLQLDWINERYARVKESDERRVAVVIGCTGGGVILTDLAWTRPIKADEFKRRIVPRRGVADWIVQLTTR